LALFLARLQEYCLGKLGKMDARIALRSFAEVQAHNAAGQCWLILDGAAFAPASLGSTIRCMLHACKCSTAHQKQQQQQEQHKPACSSAHNPVPVNCPE
jgi:hypothetical protein